MSTWPLSMYALMCKDDTSITFTAITVVAASLRALLIASLFSANPLHLRRRSSLWCLLPSLHFLCENEAMKSYRVFNVHFVFSRELIYYVFWNIVILPLSIGASFLFTKASCNLSLRNWNLKFCILHKKFLRTLCSIEVST